MAEILFHATTIVAVYDDGKGAIGGDGQVTFGQGRSSNTGRKKYAGCTAAG